MQTVTRASSLQAPRVPSHHAQPSHLKEALEGPFLDSLTGQDVGELSARVRDQQGGGHMLADELGHLRL